MAVFQNGLVRKVMKKSQYLEMHSFHRQRQQKKSPAARHRISNRNRGPVDIGTYRDQSDNRFMSQDVNNYTQVIFSPTKVPFEQIVDLEHLG